MNYFTSDTHFGNQRTLTLSKRPFDSVKQMDETIINNWNKKVKVSDTVYHLGDFGNHNIIKYLNGRLKLLPGNYDDKEFLELINLKYEDILCNYEYLRNEDCFIFHEPSLIKNLKHFYLFGHIHKLQMVKKNGLNVGMDCHNFQCIDIAEINFYRNAIENHYDENVFC